MEIVQYVKYTIHGSNGETWHLFFQKDPLTHGFVLSQATLSQAPIAFGKEYLDVSGFSTTHAHIEHLKCS